MTITEYNIRLIIIITVVIVGTPIINYFAFFKQFKDFLSEKEGMFF